MAQYKSGDQLSAASVRQWRVAQGAWWFAGLGIFFCLIFFPRTGILLFWNLLIPLAPALIVVAVGLWRNVCPLATTVLLPRHLGLSKQKLMSPTLHGVLGLISIVALYALVPLRHSVFNLSGLATAGLLVGTATIGITMGFFFDWKSAWCSSLCPVHPVEKLYGSNVLFSLPNAHCQRCVKCVVPCPDTTPNINPASYHKTFSHNLSALLIVGGLPGFIWGWFQVPDNAGEWSWASVVAIYRLPLTGMMTTVLIYSVLTIVLEEKLTQRVTAVFSAAAVSCYYWYRIPALIGFGDYAHDGMLINLTGRVPGWLVVALTLSSTVFFFWWIVWRKSVRTSWVIRPAYASRHL